MVKKILIGIAALVAGFLALVASRPSHFEIKRDSLIAAAPGAVYAELVDFRRWEAWSPWAKIDPAMKARYSGAPSGTGAIYDWVGNDEVGEGRMTLTRARAEESVDIKLEFLKPWEATSATSFRLAPSAAGTRLTWSMSGERGFVEKAVSLFM